MVSLMMPLVSHSADTGINGITWPKLSHWTSLGTSLKLGVLWSSFLITSASRDAEASVNHVRWPEKSCCTSFWLSLPRKCNGTIDNAVDIAWPIYTHIYTCMHICNMWIHEHVAPQFDWIHLKSKIMPFTMFFVSCDTDTAPMVSHD